MSAASDRALDQGARDRLRALADALIPGGEGLPAASEIDTTGKWIDRALTARPDLVQCVVELAAAPGEPDAILDRLRKDDPEAFDRVTEAISGAYLLSPRVRRLLGYPGAAPKPKPPLRDEAELYLEDGILDGVTARGPIYRPTPAG